MQALLKLCALPTLFRRARLSMGPALKFVLPGQRVEMPWVRGAQRWSVPDLPECDPEDSCFRVTDRRCHWTQVSHFRDAASALRHANATGGVMWEHYLGPTGTLNWWSLTEEECGARAAAYWCHEPAAADVAVPDSPAPCRA